MCPRHAHCRHHDVCSSGKFLLVVGDSTIRGLINKIMDSMALNITVHNRPPNHCSIL